MQNDSVVSPEEKEALLRESFLGWQCRIRQCAVRDTGGRPTEGMCPHVWIGGDKVARIIVLLTKRNPEEHTAEFRQIMRAKRDPRDRRSTAIRILAAEYFQSAATFTDRLTAVFAQDSELAEQLLRSQNCTLGFEHGDQRWVLPCRVVELNEDDVAFQATYWLTALLNHTLPGVVRILAFLPDWGHVRTTAIS